MSDKHHSGKKHCHSGKGHHHHHHHGKGHHHHHHKGSLTLGLDQLAQAVFDLKKSGKLDLYGQGRHDEDLLATRNPDDVLTITVMDEKAFDDLDRKSKRKFKKVQKKCKKLVKKMKKAKGSKKKALKRKLKKLCKTK